MRAGPDYEDASGDENAPVIRYIKVDGADGTAPGEGELDLVVRNTSKPSHWSRGGGPPSVLAVPPLKAPGAPPPLHLTAPPAQKPEDAPWQAAPRGALRGAAPRGARRLRPFRARRGCKRP